MPISAPTPPPANKKPATPAKPQVKPTAAAVDAEKIRQSREEGLNGIFTLAAGLSIAANQWADAGAFTMHGPGIAREAVAVAERYKWAGDALDNLANVSPFANLFGSVMVLGLQLAANHKKISAEKASSFGVKDPELLALQMQAEAQRQAAEYEAWIASQQDTDKEPEKAKA